MNVSEQKQMYYGETAKISSRSSLISDMIRCGDMSRDDLRKLIARRPNVYGIYQGIADNDENWLDGEVPGK